jgi:hypothetical protein
MDKSHNVPPSSPGYETSDANVRGVYKFLVALAVSLIATAFVCWLIFGFFTKFVADTGSPSPFSQTRQLPLGPQLQVNPREDLLKYRQEQQKSLETYQWENRGAGTVRVPIETAMEMLLKKGLPVQSEPPAAESVKPPTSGGKQ